MKVLYASAAATPDQSAGFLWRGLQDLLGPENVADATAGAALRGRPEGQWANDRPILHFPEHRVPRCGEDDFDLLVATSTFLRDHDWDWLDEQRRIRLRVGGKVVWFETLDGARDATDPPLPVDAVFRREIDPAVQYPYAHKPLALLCATPEAWFTDPVYGWTADKPYDVFNVSNAVSTGHPTRWQSLSPTFCTAKKRKTLAGDGVLQPNQVYLHVKRQFKLVVEGPGGEGASDNGSLWETIGLGGIPLFVGQTCRVRWPWLDGSHCLWSTMPEVLPTVIDNALDYVDLGAMRLRLKDHVLKWHTSKERARQFLQMVEADAWRGAPGPWRW